MDPRTLMSLIARDYPLKETVLSALFPQCLRGQVRSGLCIPQRQAETM